MPLKMQAPVIEDHMVVYSDGGEISEYFYHFRKLWDDCKHRVLEWRFGRYMEKIAAMRRFEHIRKRLV